MGSLKYVGKPVAADPDLVYLDYVQSVKNGDLSSTEIDQAINSGFSAYATVGYVDTRDGLLATQTYIDAQDNLRLKLSQRGVANGIAPLDAVSKVPTQFINGPMDQQWNRGPWSPSAYGAAQDVTTETTLYTVGVTDPGFPYRLVVWGNMDSHSDNDNDYPVINIRAGSATGEIVAVGNGPSDGVENLFRGDDFNRPNNTDSLGSSDWEQDYSGSGAGILGIYQNGTRWYDSGSGTRSCLVRRIKANDKYTGTNSQAISGVIDAFQPGGENRNSEDNYAYLRFYMRMNDAMTQYVAWETTEKDVRLVYTTGDGTELQLGPKTTMAKFTAGMSVVAFAGDLYGFERKFYFYRAGVLVSEVDDNTNLTAMGPNNRGWGFGVRAATRGFGQTTPSGLDSVYVSDVVPATEPIVIAPVNNSVKTGATTLYVRLARASTVATVSYNPYRPKLHILAVPA